MSNRASVWVRIYRSAFDAEAYRDAATRRPGSLLGYLALLIAIATIVTALQAHVRSVRALEEAKPWLTAHIPELHITNGALSSPTPQPYVWAESDFAFVLDTTGATTELDPKYARGVLLTKTDAIVRRSAIETRRYSFQNIPNLIVNQATIARWIQTIKSWLWVAVAIGTLVWLWIAKLLQVLLWSVVGLMVNAFAKRSLSYRALWNIGVYALTVPLVLDLIKISLGWQTPLLGWLSLILYAGYVVWGILVQPIPAIQPTGTAPTGANA